MMKYINGLYKSLIYCSQRRQKMSLIMPVIVSKRIVKVFGWSSAEPPGEYDSKPVKFLCH